MSAGECEIGTPDASGPVPSVRACEGPATHVVDAGDGVTIAACDACAAWARESGRAVRAAGGETAALLWDEHGTPTREHPRCPKCNWDGEVGSHFDEAWCCVCGWRGLLTELHARSRPAATND